MDEQILEVARSIRPHLPRLIGAEADECDRRLVELLRQAAAGADVGEAILELLTRQPATYSWAAAALADERHRPPDVQRAYRGPVTRGYSPLPNPLGADLVDAERYACPVDGNFVWWRISVGDQVPTCRDHPGTTLVPA
ncbi:MAG TPA: hypothetical protein VFV73_16775 [Streptosporangiaceae bacterium]|nr:hypothetical protein [Streptosporangiaceae bacterium]